MLLGCGCGGILELMWLWMMGGTSFVVVWSAIKAKIWGVGAHSRKDEDGDC